MKYCLDRYNTNEMYDKAVDVSLPVLNFFPDSWFVMNKMLEKLNDVVFPEG